MRLLSVVKYNKMGNKSAKLYDACKNENYDLVKKLLIKNPDININWNSGYFYTPILIACKNNRDDIVKLLLAHWPELNSQMRVILH